VDRPARREARGANQRPRWTGSSLERYDDRTGFFGMIEAQDDPEIFGALFDSAQTWLRERGMGRVRGPSISPSTTSADCWLMVSTPRPWS